jgi:hypothetical protein
MTLDIYDHHGDYEFERIARFVEGEWEFGGDQVDPGGYYEGEPEKLVAEDFDGPDTIAVDPRHVIGEEDEADTQQSTIGGEQ